ncbi:hypothetical protein SAMN03159341_12940 [Paenibacillus sp. 1_12]|nr:hypothetical protein SAMN03159341_12940 [Paenibacillus sp. 1_12]
MGPFWRNEVFAFANGFLPLWGLKIESIWLQQRLEEDLLSQRLIAVRMLSSSYIAYILQKT